MKNRKFLSLVLSVFALALSGCVKYNGKESSNPVDKAKVVISETAITLEEGKSQTLNAEVNKPNLDIYWEVANETVASLDVTTGLTVTVSALQQGKTTVSAYVNYNSRKYSASCTLTVTRKGAPTPVDPDNPDPSDPVEGDKVDTYLVIGENGRYEGKKGEDFASLFLEHAVKYEAEVGTDLPGADKVTTIVDNSTFQYWQAYDGGGALTKYTKVPNARGKILYACFGGGSGSSTPEPDPDVPTGSFTLYFEFGMDWTSPADEKVYLGSNNEPSTFVSATKQSDGNYKATVGFTGTVASVNAYINQGGDSGKYFHPTTGAKDYNKMNSTIKLGTTAVVDGGTYTITMTSWHYGMPDGGEWTDGWFNYTFKEGAPAGGGGVDPDPENTVTLYFAGIGEWTDPTIVHLGVNGTFKNAEKQSDGKYKAEFTVSSVTSINAYLEQNSGAKYFHPYNGSYDKMDSTINMSVTVEVGKSYVITFGDWHDGGHWETEGTTEHGWFDYTFGVLSA